MEHMYSRRPRAAIPSGDYRTLRASPARVPVVAPLLASLVAFLLSGLAGCTPPPPATVASGGPSLVASEMIIEADWDDADAAVRTAVRREQMALERRRAYRAANQDEHTVLVFDLRTLRGDTGELTLKDLGDGRVLVRCRIGALGSESAETALVGEIVERLHELAGKDYAPLPG